MKPHALTYGDLFTGFGGATVGAMAAGYTPLWGIEMRADVAEVANANLGGHVRVADLLDCKPSQFERVDHLHASPPCPNFSVAKAGGKETALDVALARKVAEFVTVLAPETFTLENVYAYRNSRSWSIVEDALHRAGYWVNVEHVNAADMGVPQTRKRMIVRAVRGGFVPYLPEPVQWVGWYAAVEDLLDTLPESQFAPWQLARLPENIAGSFFAVAQQSDDKKGSEFGYGNPTRNADEPALTITKQSPGWFKAFLIQSENNRPTGELTMREAKEPSSTLRSGRSNPPRVFLVDVSNTARDATMRYADEPSISVTHSIASRESHTRAWLSTGRVVAMTPRALARFQSFPDTYELPEKRTLAAYGIGNAVPPLLMQRVLEGLP